MTFEQTTEAFGSVALKEQPVRLPDGLDIGCERRRDIEDDSKVGQAAYDMAPSDPHLLLFMSP